MDARAACAICDIWERLNLEHFINITCAGARAGISVRIYKRRCWCLTDYGCQFYADDDLIAFETNTTIFSGSFRYGSLHQTPVRNIIWREYWGTSGRPNWTQQCCDIHGHASSVWQLKLCGNWWSCAMVAPPKGSCSKDLFVPLAEGYLCLRRTLLVSATCQFPCGCVLVRLVFAGAKSH